MSVFARKITVTEESPEPVEISFELPKLFTARLLNPDGTPAKRQTVTFRGYGWNNEYFSTETDDDGNFQLHKVPEFVEMTVNSPDPHGKFRLHLWFDKELTQEPEKYKEFRLHQSATIRARFVDAAGDPITDFTTNRFHYNKPGGAKRLNYGYGFHSTATAVPGEFIFPDATPNVEYHFAGDFPGIPYMRDCLSATPTESGQTLDLGDVAVTSPMLFSTSTGPKQIPVNLYDSLGKLDRFDCVTLELYSNVSTGRGSVNNITKGDYVKHIFEHDQECWMAAGFLDPSNRWAVTPLVWPPTEDWDAVTEVRVDTEPGEMIRGVVLDETTGKPIARMPFLLVQKIKSELENAPPPPHILTLEWKLRTDDQGRFALRMVPGDFVIGICDAYPHFRNASPDDRGRKLWMRNIRLELGKPIDVEFRIPPPFVGRVLTTGGRPAPKTNVEVHWLSRQTTSLQTDDKGEFRLRQPPEAFSYITFQAEGSSDKAQRLIRWIEPDEINSDSPMVFRLSNIDVIGRLLDGTGNPVQHRSISVSAERTEKTPNAERYKQPLYYSYGSSEGNGLFRISGLTPGVKYTLHYSDEDAVIIVPAAKGNTIDLGDITVP